MRTETRTSQTPRPPRGRAGWWLWAGVGSLAVGAIFAVLLVMDLTSRTPGQLQLPRVAGAPAGIAAGPVSGTWAVARGSEVGYRVHEKLFGLSHTAVGRTGEVTGGITVSGTKVVAADFSVAMGSVRTDQAGRQVAWRDFIMDTGAHPRARFRLTRPIALAAVPPVGRVVTAHATGELTLRGVTRTVEFPIRGERLSPSVLDLSADIPITFAKWRIPNPSFAVAKVGRTGTLEVLLHLTRAGRG